MGERSYELPRAVQIWPSVASPVVAVSLGAIVLLGDEPGVVLGAILGIVVVGAVYFRYTLWQPYRVRVTDVAVFFDARVRIVGIPWDELESIGPPEWDLTHRQLNWHCRNGAVLRTSASFVDQHQLLADVGRLAPHVEVTG